MTEMNQDKIDMGDQKSAKVFDLLKRIDDPALVQKLKSRSQP